MARSGQTSSPLVILLVVLTMTGCGGGSGGGTQAPREPTVVSTPTAVRVSAATSFGASCVAVPQAATLYANAEVEPHLALDRTNPNHLVAAWQQDRLSGGGARGIATSVSNDGGVTWSRPHASPFSQCAGGAFALASDPWIAVSDTVAFQVGIAFTGAELTGGARSAVLVSRSTDGGFTWSPAVTLVDDDGSIVFNDKETLTIDSTNPRYVYAVWDRIDANDHGPTLFARSVDGGVNWEPAATIYDPGNANQTIGNVAVTTPDGTVHVFFVQLEPVAGSASGLQGHLAVIRSSDKGVTWSAPSRIADLLPVGVSVPNQPQFVVRTGEIIASFAADPGDGTLYAAWEDGRFSGGNHDAIALAWSTDGGLTWSEPIRVNGDSSAPAFTPTLAVLPGGLIGVTYYDFREIGTATFSPTNVWLAVSRDRTTWRETRLAGNFDMLDAPDADGLFVGDYQGLAGSGSNFVSLYVRTNNGDTSNRTDVFADRVNADAIPAVVAAEASRKSSATPSLPEAAQKQVAEHLSAVRQARKARWLALLQAAPGMQ